jgi:hypothetical protein
VGDVEESLLNVTNVALGVVVLGFLAVLVAGLLWEGWTHLNSKLHHLPHR